MIRVKTQREFGGRIHSQGLSVHCSDGNPDGFSLRSFCLYFIWVFRLSLHPEVKRKSLRRRTLS